MAPRVVIVGGGFGGLAVAKSLSRLPVEITVIDRQNHHCFQPLLYQVATASLSPADVAWPIRSILSRQKNTRVVMDEVVGVDVATEVVRTAGSGVYPFDYLVLATGATHSYFGHDDWAPYAPGLKRIEDAVDIRGRILRAFERAEIASSDDERARLMTFVVVGGGPTGVELAGAIADTARFALSPDFRNIDPRAARIVLVEAGPRLLSAFPEKLAAYAARALTQLGVEVRTSTMVTGADPGGVTTSNGAIPASTVLWAAGVQASSAGQWLDGPRDKAGRVIVNADLSLPGHLNIFAIGDTAAFQNSDGKSIPGIAPAAKQMGNYVGAVIGNRITGSPVGRHFVYKHHGDLATIGRKAAIVSIGRLQLTGAIAWIFWSIAHIYYLIGARNRAIVVLDWLWEYITFRRGARLINDCKTGVALGPDVERPSLASAAVVAPQPGDRVRPEPAVPERLDAGPSPTR